jgi:secreted PhoX family phosphatase
MTQVDRRTFLQRGAIVGGGLVAMGPLHALGARAAAGSPPPAVTGYGPLVDKGDLFLPAAFNYQVISRQGDPQDDGNLTPGIFDGMGAFPGQAGATVLIRNHENRERPGEIPVTVPPGFAYDETTIAGNTKLEVTRTKAGTSSDGQQLYTYEVVRSFNILGGTTTNCAGGLMPPQKWIACEERVKGPSNGAATKHGYNFEVDATADGPVVAVPILAAGRFVHEAALWRGGVLYQTEDRRIVPDTVLGAIGSCLYRYIPDRQVGQSGNLAETTGPLEALKLRDEFHANMDTGRAVGVPFPVEWVPVADADHDDDTDDRRDRAPGFTPTRIQAQDLGAAYFDRQEGMWAGPGNAKIYFDCTEGGEQNLGQVWEYDPGRETLTLIYESTDSATLENPDNVVIVPQTADIFLQEDSPGEQFIRGLTQRGEIYDFARSKTNDTEFCGGCFSPDGDTLYVNQQGNRGNLPQGSPGGVTYAIYGPFEKRDGSRAKNFGNGS